MSDRWEVLVSRDGRRMLWKRYDTKAEAQTVAKELRKQGKKVTVRQENPWTHR